MSSNHPVERYALYGDPARDVDLQFLHVEPIHVRSGQFNWTIDPHSHAELHQVLMVMAGGGAVRIEASDIPIVPPALIVIPARTVHAFAFAPNTDGWVLSVAESLVQDAAGDDAAVAALFARARRITDVEAGAAEAFVAISESLALELVWTAPARGLAMRAEFLRLLVAAARLVAQEDEAAAPLGSSDALLIERFRRLVEQDFRRGAPIAAYAWALGVSDDRLLAACRRRLGEPPLAVVQRRLVLEAQRWLVYSTLSVGAIGHELGFDDPAYFSRFFRRQTGETPKAYRARTGRVMPEARRSASREKDGA
ncbi:MAG TPA: helix-turn-helix domain-containing protein [Rhodoblastus sp.]|nr:helix-turn-helix domain-containing protein [Rhodoblastus sp.]